MFNPFQYLNVGDYIVLCTVFAAATGFYKILWKPMMEKKAEMDEKNQNGGGLMTVNKHKTECTDAKTDLRLWIGHEVENATLRIEARIVRLETKMEGLWGPIGDVVKEIVKRPTHMKMDEWVDKIFSESPKDLNKEELVALKEMITVEKNKAPLELKMAYGFALGRIAFLLIDKEDTP